MTDQAQPLDTPLPPGGDETFLQHLQEWLVRDIDQDVREWLEGPRSRLEELKRQLNR